MFTQNSLINIVFADPNDTIYTESLFEFNDVNRYIWYELHRGGSCSSVYFMKKENNSFSLSTFGDKNTEPFQSGLLGSKNAKLGRWMIKKLTEKRERCAFVCPFSDFCELMEQKEWRDCLSDLIGIRNDPKRTGMIILTAPPFAEDTRARLLSCSVFDYFSVNGAQNCLCPQITMCRDSKKENLYAALSNSLGDACVFLNRFTYERICALLLRHTIQHGTDIFGELPEMAKYLTAVLNSVEFRLGQIFPELSDANGMTEYKTLYQKLDDPGLLAEIRKNSAQAKTKKNLSADEPPIYYRDERLNNCLRLKLPECTADEHSSSVLYNIKRELLSVVNREVNQNILKKLSELCVWFNPCNITREDGQIVHMLTDYLNFYVKWLYTDAGSPEEKKVLDIAELIGACLTTTFQCAENKREYKRLDLNNYRTNLMQAKANQLYSVIATQEKTLTELKDLIQSSMLDLSLINTSRNTTQVVEKLKTAKDREYEQFEKNDPVPEAAKVISADYSADTPVLHRELSPDEDFEIRADMYNFLPNKN